MIRKVLDKVILPPFLAAQTQFWLYKFPELFRYGPKQIFLEEGHQTNEYLRHLINKCSRIKGSRVLLVGCGKGEEVDTWLPWGPKQVVGVDYFDYSEEWNKKLQSLPHSSRGKVCFRQVDILSTSISLGGPFDIVASDAVFEHISNLDKALAKLSEVLSPKGVLYAGFGPLYYTFGGDHYSGWDGIENGFNHLVLKKDEYDRYVPLKQSDAESGFDDRVFIYNNLFSRLKPGGYLELIGKYFDHLDVNIGLSSNALKFRKLFPQKWADIVKSQQVAETDLLVKCLFVTATGVRR